MAGDAIRELTSLAIDGLRQMQLACGLFCFERRRNEPDCHGRSLRYTAMTVLGLHAASRAGQQHPFDLGGIEDRLAAELDNAALRPGDFGLLLWLDSISGGLRNEEIRDRLERSLETVGGLRMLEGQELGWIIQGLALSLQSGPDLLGGRILREALELVCGDPQPASGLFGHRAEGARRRFPNFATQIYLVMALSTVGKLELDKRALPRACRAADRLLELQRADGGWPWLFDASKGSVVEPYEIYSVHQHGMAPMALLRLASATGMDGYREAASQGLAWIDRGNELGLDMVDRGDAMIYRSIRRRRAVRRLALWANTAGAVAGAIPLVRSGLFLELNESCRPYEFGWLLEAWCGNAQDAFRAEGPA